MIFNIYIANHGKRVGIDDYLAILGNIVARRGHEMVVSEILYPDLVNIVIDEFTNFVCNGEIISFRSQYPHAKLVFVLSEFIETRLFVRSFNFFGGPLDAAVVAVLNVYFRLCRQDCLPPALSDWLIAAAYSPLLLVYSLLPVYYLLCRMKCWRGGKPQSLLARFHSRAYMLMRYLGLERMIGCADGVILSHAMIEAGLKRLSPTIPVLGTLCPEIDFEEITKALFARKQLYLEITGSVTPYRQKWINRINSYIAVLGIKKYFYPCKVVSFNSSHCEDPPGGNSVEQRVLLSAQSSVSTDRGVLRGAYSLHPPQSRRWKYSSPTRIFRALQYDHNMPVLTRLFNQHPIEHLCLVFGGQETLIQTYLYYKDPKKLFAYLEPRVQEYMRIAAKANDVIVAAMVTMASCGRDDRSCRR